MMGALYTETKLQTRSGLGEEGTPDPTGPGVVGLASKPFARPAGPGRVSLKCEARRAGLTGFPGFNPALSGALTRRKKCPCRRDFQLMIREEG